MLFRPLGETGWQVSALSLGGSAWLSRVGRRESEKAIRTALECGINFFDTAPMYGQGQSEALVARLTASSKNTLYISTKVGQVVPGYVRILNPIKPLVRAALRPFRGVQQKVGGVITAQTRSQQFDASSMVRSVEGSLRRMRREMLDLLLLHSPSVDVIQSQQFIEPLERLADQGKIVHYGIACDSIETVAAAAGLPAGTLSAVQIELHEGNYEAVRPYLEVFDKKGVGVVARSPFAALRENPTSAKNDPSHLLRNALQRRLVASTLVGMTKAEHIIANCSLCDQTFSQQQRA